MQKSLLTLIIALFMVSYANSKFSNINNPNILASSAIIIDSNTKLIILDKNANKKISPSSMSKLMTLYIIFSELKRQNITLTSKVIVSANAVKKGHYSTGGSTMFLKIGDTPTVEELVRGIVVSSGNDASIAMAEYIASSEEEFIKYMNQVAQELGLTSSHFNNANGWPDLKHYSTAKDIAVLAYRVIHDFPEYYHYFSETSFTYNGITQNNRNLLLKDDALTVDGLKTGHTQNAGFSLAFSAMKNNMRLIGVISGLKLEKDRNIDAKKLLNWGFLNFSSQLLFKKGELIKKIAIFNGSKNELQVYATSDIYALVPNNVNKTNHQTKIKLIYYKVLNAPISKDEQVGQIIVEMQDTQYNQVYNLYAKENIAVEGVFFNFLKTPYALIRKLLYY